MVKRVLVAFADEDHNKVVKKKEELKRQLGVSKLSWESYLLHISGVKEIANQ